MSILEKLKNMLSEDKDKKEGGLFSQKGKDFRDFEHEDFGKPNFAQVLKSLSSDGKDYANFGKPDEKKSGGLFSWLAPKKTEEDTVDEIVRLLQGDHSGPPPEGLDRWLEAGGNILGKGKNLLNSSQTVQALKEKANSAKSNSLKSLHTKGKGIEDSIKSAVKNADSAMADSINKKKTKKKTKKDDPEDLGTLVE